VLFTDKTGTLTEGSLRFMRSTGRDGRPDDEPLLLGLLCNEAVVTDDHAVGGNPPSAPSPSARCFRPPRSPALWASSPCQVSSSSPGR